MRYLIDTEAACLYSGLSKATLYRWASEGKLTNYGGKRGAARWDVRELPRYDEERNISLPAPIETHQRSCKTQFEQAVMPESFSPSSPNPDDGVFFCAPRWLPIWLPV